MCSWAHRLRPSLPVRAQRCCALHRASRLAAGTGAALLRPTSRLAPRCRYGRSAAAPYIAPRASLPVRAQRCCAPTSRLAPRCRYGRSDAAPLHRASRLAAGTGAALLRPYIAPRASLPVRAQRCCAPTSRLAPRCRYGRSAAAPLHRASRLAAGTGAALLRPYIAPRASLPVRAQRCCAPTSRLAPRCRYGRSAAAPLHRASRLAPRCRYGRSAAAPLHRASRLIPSRLIPSRLIPSRLIPSRPSSLTPASPATLRPGTR
jgi:hypothetical protein